jgi:transcription antitermination factor NusG
VLGDEECNMMSAEELEKIRAGLSSGLLLRPHPNVAAGTRVRVRDGIFGGVEGVVTDLRHQCKVVVSLFALRQSFSLDVSPDSLQVLESAVSIPALNQAPAMGY